MIAFISRPGLTSLAATLLVAVASLAAVPAIAQPGKLPCATVAQAPEIPFGPLEDKSLKDPDNPTKVFHVDLARLEHDCPLSRADLMKLTPDNILKLPQELIDQIYGRLSAGPIPDGPYAGDLFFVRGEDGKTRLGEIIGGIKGRLADGKVATLERIGEHLWKGKMFYREQRVLRNFIEDAAIIRPLIDNVESVPRAELPRASLFGKFDPSNTVWLLFPAKLHCGQSLLDGRRESIIIDYAFNDEIEGFRRRPDALANRDGLRIRDEIRMIRPGFYLGRAYANKIFLLNFILYNDDVAQRDGAGFTAGGPVAEDCWVGEQQRHADSR
ncbi:MAG TPA: hypothetical protein VJ890_06845 [Vineibacter sp.]|nr:hypothetical protein [Vineibacter sp.]